MKSNSSPRRLQDVRLGVSKPNVTRACFEKLPQEKVGPSNGFVRAKSQVSQQLQVPVVDMTSDFKAKGKELYLGAVPVHLNASGNELIARRLLTSVTNLFVP